jgi:hypothetical protein
LVILGLKGTGVSVMRAFLQERIVQGATGKNIHVVSVSPAVCYVRLAIAMVFKVDSLAYAEYYNGGIGSRELPFFRLPKSNQRLLLRGGMATIRERREAPGFCGFLT